MPTTIASPSTCPKDGLTTYNLAHQLIAAKLNIAQGAAPTVVFSTIMQADNWLIDNPLGSRPKNPAREKGLTYGNTLDDYNNGVIGPGHCP